MNWLKAGSVMSNPTGCEVLNRMALWASPMFDRVENRVLLFSRGLKRLALKVEVSR